MRLSESLGLAIDSPSQIQHMLYTTKFVHVIFDRGSIHENPKPCNTYFLARYHLSCHLPQSKEGEPGSFFYSGSKKELLGDRDAFLCSSCHSSPSSAVCPPCPSHYLQGVIKAVPESTH